MSNRLFCFITSIIMLILVKQKLPGQDAYTIYSKMISKIEAVNRVQFLIEFHERHDGEVVSNKAKVKVNHVPFEVYMYQLLPREGVEVLYNSKVDPENVYINPNGFPWFTLAFGMNSKALRDRYRNSLYNLGYGAIIKLDSFYRLKYGDSYESHVKLENETKCFDGSPCFTVSISMPDFKYINYIVKNNENLITLSAKYIISEYMILEQNPGIKDYFDVIPGQNIIIPSDYAKKITIYIDSKTFLPRELKFYDEKELFQNYRYSNIIINPPFRNNEFSIENPEYNF